MGHTCKNGSCNLKTGSHVEKWKNRSLENTRKLDFFLARNRVNPEVLILNDALKIFSVLVNNRSFSLVHFVFPIQIM